jgi:hypothetical protein
MRFRALALLVAASIATAPSFVVACQVACATAEAAESTAVEHGCHHDAAPTESTESTGLVAVHGCGHDDAELATSGEKPSPFVMAFVAIAVSVGEPIPSFTPTFANPDFARARPPDRSLRTTQLRV